MTVDGDNATDWCLTQPDCEFDRSVCVNHNGLPSELCVFPGTYALIGAASMLGGVTRMTVSLTVILLETTQDIQYLLPIMTVLIVSKWVGDIFNISLYDMHVEFKCIPFVEDLPPTGMEHLVAADVMSTNVVTFAEIEPAHEVYARLCSCKHNGFPVVSIEDKISGTILRSHLVKALKMGAFCSAEGVPIEGSQQLCHDDLAVTLESEIEDVNELPDSGFDGGKDISRDSAVVSHLTSVSRHLCHQFAQKQRALPCCAAVHALNADVLNANGNYSISRLTTADEPMALRRVRGSITISASCSRTVPFMTRICASFRLDPNRCVPVVLLSVYRLYRGIGIRHLPVIDINNKIVGILCRKELRTDWKGDSLI